ncbi:DUF3293 domain-containing protein [Roseateles sp.]|uniref:DUF3293 domain-containing protein n=1 Tax=Roseateles sp. TaxID=1971397 RepID=UPI00286C39D9|nr:DUF3293 domain-containing protein [Roseateles sp.]
MKHLAQFWVGTTPKSGSIFGRRQHGVNTQRNLDLAAELRTRSLASVEGIGQHPSNQHPGEVSYLIFGLTLEAAKTLGTKWEQNAIIWSGADAMPQLITLR